MNRNDMKCGGMKTQTTYAVSSMSNLPVANIRLSRRTFLAIGACSHLFVFFLSGCELTH